MVGVKKLPMGVSMVLMVAAVSFSGKWWVSAQTHHHVVGGDRGWDMASDIGSWSDGRIFSVGDKIWFSYSAAQESIVELKSKEEFYTCDLSNPIRMYTDGLNSILLEEEGIRYFASSKLDSCRKGLKLHVEVVPRQKPGIKQVTSSSNGDDGMKLHADDVLSREKHLIRQFTASHGSALARLADAPATPKPSGSSSTRFGFGLVLTGFGLFCVGI